MPSPDRPTTPDHVDVPLAELLSLAGRAAVVTGGGRGIGAATVRRLTKNLALEFAGQPDDVARMITVLASDLAAWVTGWVLPVDAGDLAR
jgi:NAD(P)-dependent dehydrogenase (short-subunit alcohol dehydrogenase family)